MKKIVLLVVALVMCLTMSGLAENEPMEWVQTGDFWYVMSDEFYFQIPADWEEQTENGNEAIVFSAVSADHATAMQIEKTETTCKNNEELKKTIDKRYVIQEKKVNGIEAEATTLFYEDEEQKTTVVLLPFFAKGIVYKISFSAEFQEEEINTILASINVTELNGEKEDQTTFEYAEQLADLKDNGQLIEGDGFQFYIPADWEAAELTDEDTEAGYVFAAASADEANQLIITYQALDAAMTAEEVQPGLAEVYPTATVMDLNGTSVVAFHDADEDVLGIVVMDTVDPGYYIFMFTPASDADFLPVADAIAASYTAVQ